MSSVNYLFNKCSRLWHILSVTGWSGWEGARAPVEKDRVGHLRADAFPVEVWGHILISSGCIHGDKLALRSDYGRYYISSQ